MKDIYTYYMLYTIYMHEMFSNYPAVIDVFTIFVSKQNNNSNNYKHNNNMHNNNTCNYKDVHTQEEEEEAEEGRPKRRELHNI